MNIVRNKHLTVVIITGTGRTPLVVATDEKTPRAALKTGDNRLEPGEALSLTRSGQTLRVVSGSAWITFDGQDTTLLAGQEMILEPGKNAAVISALEEEPLVYRLFDAHEL